MDGMPIIDLQPLLDSVSGGKDILCAFDPQSEITLRIAKQVTDAFKQTGYVYLLNHGIQPNVFEKVNATTRAFFELPVEVKEKYRPTGLHGWRGLQLESVDPTKPGDYKESYNVTPYFASLWPNSEIHGFEGTLQEFYGKQRELSLVILKLMGLGLGLKDPDFFAKCHNIDTKPNSTTLRCVQYPPIPSNIDLAPGTMRCGEHSDYGSITLIWQDQSGGLEVKTRSGGFCPAVPIEGSLLVNVGDLMQRWTSDILVSTRHRVVIPEEEIKMRQCRRSIAFFVMPDDEAIIACVDESNKYPPISTIDYLNERVARIY